MIAATAWCGMFYSIVGGMPIVSSATVTTNTQTHHIYHTFAQRLSF